MGGTAVPFEGWQAGRPQPATPPYWSKEARSDLWTDRRAAVGTVQRRCCAVPGLPWDGPEQATGPAPLAADGPVLDCWGRPDNAVADAVPGLGGSLSVEVMAPARQPGERRWQTARSSFGSPSRCAASWWPTATGCSARSTTPRTWSRRPICERGAPTRGSRARGVRGPFVAACLAVPDRDQPVPDRARAPQRATVAVRAWRPQRRSRHAAD